MIELEERDVATAEGEVTYGSDGVRSEPALSIDGVDNSKVERKESQRNSIYILGEEIERDIESINIRLKYGQIFTPIFGSIGIVLYFIGNILYRNKNIPILAITIACTALSIFFIIIMYYKNTSTTIAKRLLKNVGVTIMLLSGIAILIIDFYKPASATSKMYAVIYAALLLFFISLDVITVKSRKFVLVACFLFSSISLYNLYVYFITELDTGVILFRINGNPIYKRSTKRTIFLQVFLFSFL